MSRIIEHIDHITEELADIKKSLLISEIGSDERSKRAWDRVIRTSQEVKWDGVDAVEEIRRQREKI